MRSNNQRRWGPGSMEGQGSSQQLLQMQPNFPQNAASPTIGHAEGKSSSSVKTPVEVMCVGTPEMLCRPCSICAQVTCSFCDGPECFAIIKYVPKQ